MGHTSLAEPIDILLVEDNPGDVRLVEEAFSTASDFETNFTVFSDGVSAVEYLSEPSPVDDEYPLLLLLDLNLPRMDGFEVLEAIRDDPGLSRLPVLVLTSSTDEDDVADCYERAANAYLTKPNGPDEFDALVEAVEHFWFETVRLPPTP